MGKISWTARGWTPAGPVKEIGLNFGAPYTQCKVSRNPPKRVSKVSVDTNLNGRVGQQLHHLDSAEVAPDELPLFARVVQETVVGDPVPWSLRKPVPISRRFGSAHPPKGIVACCGVH